jgi:acyl-CoA synthetase (NDP forming)
MRAIQVKSITDQLFRPRSIALIGASENPDSVGYALLHNVLSGEYTGTVYPINPKYAGHSPSRVLETPTRLEPYRASVTDLPYGSIDLALVVTPAPTIPEIVQALGEAGNRAVVIISAGFGESGDAGYALAEDLKHRAEHFGMALVGPNCLGIANADEQVRLNATFAQISPHPGHGAIFSQSGAVGLHFMNLFRQSGLGFRQFVSLGNSLVLQPRTLLQAWQSDPEIRYILGYLEAGEALADLRDIGPSVTREKPLLLIQAGQSETGAQAARSHTGAMAGNQEAVNAFARQSGILRFDSMTTMLAAAEAFEHCPPLCGNRLAVLSNAGGYAVMVADLLETETEIPDFEKLTMANLADSTSRRLSDLLPKTASARNPIDTTATFPHEHPERFREALLSVAMDPEVDACLVAIVEIMTLEMDAIARIAGDVQSEVGKPIVFMFSSPRCTRDALNRRLQDADRGPVALYTSLFEALAGITALNRQRLRQARPLEERVIFPQVMKDSRASNLLLPVRKEGRQLLTTAESLELLETYGIRVVGFCIAKTLEEALPLAESIGYPVAIKLNSKTVTHKTEVGGVKVDIRTPEELRIAFAAMLERLAKAGIHGFGPGEGIMIQQYLPRGRELILGVKTDPHFGKLVMIGRGGIYAPIDHDVQVRLHPLSLYDIREMITGIRAYVILKGYRGKPGIDFQALENALQQLSRLVLDFPEISELDINPYLALPANQGSGIAVDARVLLE